MINMAIEIGRFKAAKLKPINLSISNWDGVRVAFEQPFNMMMLFSLIMGHDKLVDPIHF